MHTECGMPSSMDLLDFLGEIFSVLIVEDDRDVADSLAEALRTIPLLKVDTAESMTAVSALLLERRYHLAFMDLGITDQNDDEFWLLRHHGSHLPTIVLTGSRCVERGACAQALGAQAVFAKPIFFTEPRVLAAIHRCLLLGVFAGRRTGGNHPVLAQAIESLIQRRPPTVGRWAVEIGIAEGYLQSLCREMSFPSPKVLLDLLVLLDTAIDCSFRAHMPEAYPTDTPLPPPNQTLRSIRRLYERRREDMDRLLRA